MGYPLVQFVSSPGDPGMTVRYDFTATDSSSRKVLAESVDIGVPEFSGEPEGVGVDYGSRTLSFTQRVRGSESVARARLSTLARELLRSENWVKFQWHPSSAPVYFKTFRGEPGALSLEQAMNGAWDITVPLVAEGFAYGARETLAAVTIDNDPSSGSNPTRIILPTIKGDAPAPLRIEVNPTNADPLTGYRLMFALLATEEDVAGPILWQVGGSDGWTAGTDTAASSSDAAYVGGNYRAVSFATNDDMATRLSGEAPAVLPSGTYKVLVRVARSDTDSTFALRFGQSVAFSYRYGETVKMDRDPSTGSGHATWVDLGEFTHPWGHHAPAGQEGFAVAPDIALQAQRLSGSGSLRLDAFLLVPVDTTDTILCRTLFAEFATFGIDVNGGWGIFDGDTESVWGFSQFAAAASGMIAELQGDFPAAVPGAVNMLHFLQQVNGRKPFFGSDSSDSISVDTVLTISYHPRWLWLGAG